MLVSGFTVKQETVRLALKAINPAAVEQRKKNKLKRRAYHSKGANYTWHQDGYDKLKPFGICINGAVDGFSRFVVWLRAGMTNNDPKVIGGYYLDSITEFGGIPVTIRSDLGTENGVVRKIQTKLRKKSGEDNSNESNEDESNESDEDSLNESGDDSNENENDEDNLNSNENDEDNLNESGDGIFNESEDDNSNESDEDISNESDEGSSNESDEGSSSESDENSSSKRPPFLYGTSIANQRIESWWNILRKHNADFWRNKFSSLIDENYFNGGYVHKNVIRFVFMDIIQGELDQVKHEWNIHRIRKNNKSASPSGKPYNMIRFPEKCGGKQCLINIKEENLEMYKGYCTYLKLPCEESAYNFCASILEDNHLPIPNRSIDLQMAFDLYKFLIVKLEEYGFN